jgi:exopolyphosphatase/guanosine-5'-triphosphate,3'-diphosphate pyrophosphatase
VIAGLISIGTNSTRALVADIDAGKGRSLLHRSTGTRIGAGLKERGHLEAQPMRRTLEAIREHCRAMEHLVREPPVIATSALRRADNAAEFVAAVREITGTTLQVLSGDDEARCSFVGAVSGLSGDASTVYGVLDTGGGSTEYAVGDKRGPHRFESFEIGAVRLTEAVPELAGTQGSVGAAPLDRARALADEAIAGMTTFPHIDRLLFVGGSATTTVSLTAGKREMFEYAELTRDSLQTAVRRLAAMDLEARKALPGMNPQRADILLAGALVLDAVFERTMRDRAVVSTNDVLLGFLLQRYLPNS